MSETFRVGAPPAAPAPAVPRRRLPLAAIAVLAALVLAGGAVAGWLLMRDDTITVTGTIEIGSERFTKMAGGTCEGDGGYSDIRQGAQVVVSDATGTTVGIGRLGSGSWIGAHCELPFEVEVPAGSDFYGIRVAERNTVQYEADRLTSPVVLSIGD